MTSLNKDIKRLLELTKCDHKDEFVGKVTCSGSLNDTAHLPCVEGTCGSCPTLRKLWRRIRHKILSATDTLLEGASSVWTKPVKWTDYEKVEVIIPPKKRKPDGPTTRKELRRVGHEGKLFEFLDTFVQKTANYIPHRFKLHQHRRQNILTGVGNICYSA